MGRRTPVGAGLLIVRLPDEKILLVKRSDEVTMSGYWAAPGGSVEEGEIEIEAALREGEEELGGLPRDIQIDEEPSQWSDGETFRFATYLGVTSDRSWEPEINWENDDWRWFNPNRLPRLVMPGTQKAIQDLLR